MKLLKRNISGKDGSGTVVISCEVPEDLWHTYNLLQEGDLVRSSTVRKVTKSSSTGSTTSQKLRLSLTIEIEKIEFDGEGEMLRISGPNRELSAHVKMGAYHTLSIEIGKQFSIEKFCWDQIFLERIEEACNPERQAEIAAAVMNLGIANLCLVTSHMTITKAKIDINIPKKRPGVMGNNHSKAINRFFEALYQSILRHVDFQQVKCVLLASPGYVKDDFFNYLCTEAIRRDDRVLIENKPKFILCRSSSGHKHALEEVFSDPSVLSRLSDTKAAKETEILNKFMRMIDVQPERAYYGYFHVNQANDELAIENLLITDELFRSTDLATRKKYVKLVESVRENGGNVYILSTCHVSGVQLQQVSGVAAILRYPLPDLAELEEQAEQLVAAAGENKDMNKGDNNGWQPEKVDRVEEDMRDMGLL